MASTVPGTTFDLSDREQFESNIKDGKLVIPVGTVEILGRFDKQSSDRKNVEEIIIPGSVREIGNGAFSQCKTLITIVDDGFHLRFVGTYAFYEANIQRIRFGKKVKHLGEFCFARSKIRSLRFQKGFGFGYIPEGAFFHTRELEFALIPSSVSSIEFKAFSESALKSIKFVKGSHLEVLGVECFSFTNIESVRLGSKLRAISKGAFCDCKEFKVLNFEKAAFLRIICEDAFWHTKLTDVSISPSIELVGGYAFPDETRVTVMPRDEASLLGVVSDSFNGSSTAHECVVLESSQMEAKKNEIYSEIFESLATSDPPLEESPEPEIASGLPLEPEATGDSPPELEVISVPPLEEPPEPEATSDSPFEEPEPEVILDPPLGEPEPVATDDPPPEEPPKPEVILDSPLVPPESEVVSEPP
ncbi:MAG: leucine-rich repeat domain-containing protein, partial [Clostridiales bacterium]|nr:leucine-rich repeat domain-containing protein [Clostridiales bacterium]